MRSIAHSAPEAPNEGIAPAVQLPGVEASEGAYSEGRDEPLDIMAADAADERRTDGPLLLVGWSFGGDMALGIDDPRITARASHRRCGFGPSVSNAVGHDPRSKLLVLAATTSSVPGGDRGRNSNAGIDASRRLRARATFRGPHRIAPSR